MSREAVEAVIGKAVLDGEFREALFANPEEMLAGYDLSEEEVAALKSIDAETMETLAGTLDERISKAFIAFESGSDIAGPGTKGIGYDYVAV
jgi:hypothetical protein